MSTTSENGFEIVESPQKLLKLQAVLTPFLPRSGQILNILKLKLQGRFTPKNPVDFYIYREDYWDSFVVTLQRPNIWSPCGVVIFSSLHPTLEMMERFESLIPWEKVPMFCSVDSQFFTNHLMKLCEKHNVLESNKKFHPCESNAVDPQIALGWPDISDPKEKIELRPLSKSDVEKMLLHYELKAPHTAPQVELALERLASIGLYVDGVLACSAVLSPVGLINMLHTDAEFRRRGFGLMVMKTLSKIVAQMGLIPMAENEVWNQASRQTQMRAGFKAVGATNWTNLSDH